MPIPEPRRTSVRGDFSGFWITEFPVQTAWSLPAGSKGACAIGVHPVRPPRRKECCLQEQVRVWTALRFSPALVVMHM